MFSFTCLVLLVYVCDRALRFQFLCAARALCVCPSNLGAITRSGGFLTNRSGAGGAEVEAPLRNRTEVLRADRFRNSHPNRDPRISIVNGEEPACRLTARSSQLVVY